MRFHRLSKAVHPPPESPLRNWRKVVLFTMLYLVGLGLADERDITVKGLDIVKHAARVYLEAYTSILLVDKQKLVRQGIMLKVAVCADRLTGALGIFLWPIRNSS